jgi:hypothetical protein
MLLLLTQIWATCLIVFLELAGLLKYVQAIKQLL